MNKKNINIVLIIGVVLIWGILIYYHVLGSFQTDNDLQSERINTAQTNHSFEIKKDTFILKEYKKDPFLHKGKILRRTRVNTIQNKNSKSTVAKKVKIVASKVKWPDIKYLGYVQKERAKFPLLILEVNGKIYRVKIKQEFLEGVSVVNFYRDSLLIENKSIERIFIKKK